MREGAGTAHPPRRTLFVLNVPPYCSPVSGAGARGVSRRRGRRAGLVLAAEGIAWGARGRRRRSPACVRAAVGRGAGAVPEGLLVRSVVRA